MGIRDGQSRIMDMNRRLFLLRAALLLCLTVRCSDKIFEPQPTSETINWAAGIWYFDAASDDGRILLRWRTGRTGWDPVPPPDWGPPPEPPPAVGRVAVFLSTEGPERDFTRVAVHDRDGPDSVWVEDLRNSVPYYFRISTYKPSGGLLGQSAPLMSTSGPVPIRVHKVVTGVSYTSISTPAWSPDGQQLAFVRANSEGIDGYEHNVSVFDMDSGTHQQLTQYVGPEHHLGDPAWSPDGVYIAYEYSPTRTAGEVDYRIWRTAADHFAAAPITAGRVDSYPAWAANGSIVFCRGSHGPPNIPEIFRASPTSWTPEPLTSDQSSRKYHPSANPVNGRIVYSAAGLNSLVHHLHTVDPGSPPRQLTDNRYWMEKDPVWDADGRRVIFASDRSGHFEIWSLDIASGAYVQLTRGKEDQPDRTAGALSPDGTLLAYWQEPRYGSYASLSIVRLTAP
jgi:Tol biopolymer transport system component